MQKEGKYLVNRIFSFAMRIGIRNMTNNISKKKML